MGAIVHRIDKLLGHIENTILFLGMAVALFVSLLNVVMRYIFSSPLTWPPELARYCHVLIVFIGASAAIKAGTHLKVDILYQFIPRLKGFSDIFRHFTVVVFAVAVIYLSKNLVYMQYITKQNSIALGIPFYILYAIPGVAAMLMIIRVFLEVLSHKKEAPS